jgi:anaerobic magnesium-protoporphyrin IX monomethyl ester cyclase
MRVLLINPPYTTEDRYGRDLGKFGPLNEPLGLAYLAANLERGGHEVAILDAPALGLTSGGIRPFIEKGAYDLVGVTMLTPMYARSVEVIRVVRHTSPGTGIVVGGPHPTILPEETLGENREIDYGVIGEGEFILLDLVNTLERGKVVDAVPGLAYRKDGRIIINPPPKMIGDLDDLPMPARHLLPMEAYHMTRSRTRSGHAFTVSVARGCPFNCGFCCRIFGRKVRHHSPERIVEEIRTLVDRYGAGEINLEADTLTMDRRFVDALCDRLIDSGLSKEIAWTCESRVDTITEAMLRKMKEAGCWQISYGVETGSQRLLNLIHKDITLERIRGTFALTKEVGITIRGFYMLGLPTETREESLKTIAFARELDARWSQFTLFTPFPGTELYDMAVREGGLASRDWSDYKTHGGWTEGGLAYVPKGRSPEEMKTLQKRAYSAVYLRPGVILRFLRDIDSPAKIREYMTGFWVLLKNLLPPSGRSRGVVRIERGSLERLSKGVYVDSPVYFSGNSLVRSLNWRKLDFALSHLLMEDNRRVLDLGCGNGVMLPTLSGRFDLVAGIDLHTNAAARLKHEYGLENVSLLSGDGRRLPFRDNSFHTVLAFSSIEHFRNLQEVTAEIARVVEPGGFLLFLSPSENMFYRLGRRVFGYEKPEDHYHSAGEIMEVLKEYFTREIDRDFPVNFPPGLSVYRLGRFRRG